MRLAPLLALSPLAGCLYHDGLVRSVDYSRTTMQVGAAQAPTAPHGTGPQLEPGQVGVKGALEYGAIPEAKQTRAEGASGALLATAWARGQVTVGVTDWLQLGAELEGSPAQLLRPVATDTSPDGWSRMLVRGGIHMRASFRTSDHFALEPFMEAEASELRWFHSDTITETDTIVADGGSTTVTVEGTQDFNHALYLGGRTGLGFALGRPQHVQFRVGPYITNAPWIYGSWSDTWGCDYYRDGDVRCTKPDHEPAQVSTILVPGVFGTLNVPIGSHVALSAGGWVDGIPKRSDEEGTITMVRPGATASLEFLLGGAKSDAPAVTSR